MAIVKRNGLAWTVTAASGEVSLPDDCVKPTGALAGGIVSVMPDNGREHGVCVVLDSHGKPISYDLVASGTVDTVQLHPRDVFAFALSTPGARYVGVAHNHPSGDVTPSGPDKGWTSVVATAGRFLGLDLLWSIVVTHRSTEWAAIDVKTKSGHVPPPPGGDDEGVPPPPGGDEDGDEQGNKGEDEGEDEGEKGDGEGDEDGQGGSQTGGAAPGGAHGQGASADDLAAALDRLLGGGAKK